MRQISLWDEMSGYEHILYSTTLPVADGLAQISVNGGK